MVKIKSGQNSKCSKLKMSEMKSDDKWPKWKVVKIKSGQNEKWLNWKVVGSGQL